MTEKRFTYEYDEYNGNLFDNEFNTFYHIEDSDENIELLCNRLNELVDENEKLKARIEYLERKIQRERTSAIKEHEKWEKEIQKENEQLKQQKTELLRLIENNIEIYENITNVEYQGEIQGKLTLLYNLREVILK